MRKNLFYTFMSLAVIGIIALPVGIANIVLGYILGDSPCTSCWALRIMMVIVATAGLFILRYGLRLKYIAMILLASAYGLWNAFWHLGLMAQNDIGQGQAMMIFNVHTQMWAAIVFWAVILVLGLILIFNSHNLNAFLEDVKAQGGYREFRKIEKVAFIVFFVVVTSNAFQALISVGPPPYTGADSPTRFTLNPKYIQWNTLLPNMFSEPSLRGSMGVEQPLLAKKSKYDNKAQNGPLGITDKLQIVSKKSIDLKLDSPISGLRFNGKQFAVATEEWNLYMVDKNFNSISKHLEIDHLYFPVVLEFAGVDFMGENIKIMGINKAYIIVKEDDKADEVAGFANIKEGADKFSVVDRGMFNTIRANKNYINNFVANDKYSFAITVPDNLQKNFIVLKQLNSDGMLSGEFTPSIDANITLKKDRSLGEYYTNALFFKDGLLHAVSANYNTILAIDVNSEKVVKTYSFPEQIKNLRTACLVGDSIYAISYEDNINYLYILK